MFYVVDPLISYLEVKDIHYKETGCSSCHRHERTGGIQIAMTRISELLPVIEPFDRLAFSEHLIRVLQKGGVTGWRSFPERVKVVWAGKARKPRIPVYHEIEVTGRAGHVSQYPDVVMQKECPACGHKTWSVPKNGFEVRADLWDGSDIFWIEQFPVFLAHERFVEFVRTKKIRGFNFIPTQEWYYQFD